MAAILALVNQILSILADIRSAVNYLRSTLPTKLTDIENQTNAVWTLLVNPDHGWNAVHTAILSPGAGVAHISDQVLTMSGGHTLQDVLDALNPVTLPETPPAGYGGADAAAVWEYILYGGAQTGGALQALYTQHIAAGQFAAVLLAGRPWFAWSGDQSVL